MAGTSRVISNIRLLIATNGSSLTSLIKRTQAAVKVRPDLRTNLHEEVEQWVIDAEGIQVELRTALQVEAIVDSEFKRPLDMDDLAKEVNEAKEWLGSLTFTVDPAFLDVEMNLVPGPTVLRHLSKEPKVKWSTAKDPEDT
ncbi:hypothetical protein JB92DRAFT_3115078 [Gautieria morchelliformis]|nr:hypothetical protein JB92DRAFT_3115078 [Gautieria morchelliformis]